MKKELATILPHITQITNWVFLTGRGLSSCEQYISNLMIRSKKGKAPTQGARIIRSISDLRGRRALKQRIARSILYQPAQLSADQLRFALVMDSTSCERLLATAHENGDDVVDG